MIKFYVSLLSDIRMMIKMFLNFLDYFVNWEDLRKGKKGKYIWLVME